MNWSGRTRTDRAKRSGSRKGSYRRHTQLSLPLYAMHQFHIAFRPAKDPGHEIEVVRLIRTVGIILWIAAAAIIIELIVNQTFFIGPVLVYVAMRSRLDKKRRGD